MRTSQRRLTEAPLHAAQPMDFAKRCGRKKYNSSPPDKHSKFPVMQNEWTGEHPVHCDHHPLPWGRWQLSGQQYNWKFPGAEAAAARWTERRHHCTLAASTPLPTTHSTKYFTASLTYTSDEQWTEGNVKDTKPRSNKPFCQRASCRYRNPPPKVSEKQLNHNYSYVQAAEITIAVDAFIWLESMKPCIQWQEGKMFLTSTFSSWCKLDSRLLP